MPTAGMPSRARMVLAAGDAVRGGRSREAQLYSGLASSSRQRMLTVGDPFLGGLFRVLGKGLGAIGRVVAPALGLQLPQQGLSIPSIPSVPDFRRSGSPREILSGVPGVTFGPPVPKIVIPTLPTGARVAGVGGRRRRRMNPLNPRALRRALSRASSFARFARHAMRITFGKAPKVRFKLRGRRRK